MPAKTIKANIHAICRVELKNGTQIEGIICAVQGQTGVFYKNGFGYIFPGDTKFTYNLFSLTSAWVHGSSVLNRADPITKKSVEATYYYLQNSSSSVQESDHAFDPKTGKVAVIQNRQVRFEALRQFHLFQDLKDNMLLPRQHGFQEVAHPVPAILVKVADIKTIKLVEKPSEKWVQTISNARKRWKSKDPDWALYDEPLWYHDLYKEPTRLRDIQIAIGDSTEP